MNLQLRQAIVQNAGTINGFNYAYCKTLYENALKCLSNDFVYDDGNVFPIKEWSLVEFQKKVEFVKEYTDKYDNSSSDEEKEEEWRGVVRSATLRLKKDSLLLILIDHISEQLNTEGVHISSLIVSVDEVKTLINETSAYFAVVKKYLAMFE
jgi:hypothetical protein